ncbi:MAG: tetratricopeptide repeat protein [Planctomycetia bacterium]
MRYDRDGFPIPAEFDAPVEAGAAAPSRRRVGAGKRLLVGALLAAVILPVVFGPAVMPSIREAVVVWSLERAALHEVRDDLPAAVAAMSRAIDWSGGDTDLLCMRSMLRLQDQDAAGAISDADEAAARAPTSPRPPRVRALAHVVAGNIDAALADAERVVQVSGAGDPEALNHRAYIRALVGRELSEAMADIEIALAGRNDGPPEFLDTRGFVLHLLGRQQEAVDDLNVAIDGLQRQRRRVMQMANGADDVELAQRLRWLDQSLAVMHHHRALACQAIGLEAQAEQDFETARKKGFDPSRGRM